MAKKEIFNVLGQKGIKLAYLEINSQKVNGKVR